MVPMKCARVSAGQSADVVMKREMKKNVGFGLWVNTGWWGLLLVKRTKYTIKVCVCIVSIDGLKGL